MGIDLKEKVCLFSPEGVLFWEHGEEYRLFRFGNEEVG